MLTKEEIQNLENLLLSGNEDSIKVGLAIVDGMEEVPEKIQKVINRCDSLCKNLKYIDRTMGLIFISHYNKMEKSMGKIITYLRN